MDEDLKQKIAPRRNKRYAQLRDFKAEAEWAETLYWKTNDYGFYRMFHALLDRLDSNYRGRFGLRVDQLMSREDLLALAHSTADWYQQEEQRFQGVGIYLHLHHILDRYLDRRARKALMDRRERAGVVGQAR